uniref:Odorant receptor n=1 Tax=Bradysia odoriphaga TaxID=1564500 RepID=A0A6B9CEN2_9DIPT|nr:odorant receptor 19 [Bradysia odoriphaga]
MFKIVIPNTFYQLVRLNYLLRIWSDSESPDWREHCLHLIYFFYLVGFMVAVAVGSYATSDKDESVFLVVLAIVYFVMVYRLRYILWQRKDFIYLIEQIGTSYTEDQNEFVKMSDELIFFTKIVRGYLGFALSGSVPAVFLYPFFNEKRSLLFNIAFPFDRTKSEIAFWMAYLFVVGGLLWAALCIFFTVKTWYLMLCLSVKYKMLGNRFRNLGKLKEDESQKKISTAERHRVFYRDLIVAIRTYDHINSVLNTFASNLENLFFLQVLTGAISICGGIYTLAFSRHENMVLDGYNCAFLVYSIFDIYMIMYLGNEIKFSSDQLSYRLLESDWIEQSALCKKSIIILTERLKRPQELTVGKLYPMNLSTFTSIARGAYSMLNVLQHFRS